MPWVSPRVQLGVELFVEPIVNSGLVEEVVVLRYHLWEQVCQYMQMFNCLTVSTVSCEAPVFIFTLPDRNIRSIYTYLTWPPALTIVYTLFHENKLTFFSNIIGLPKRRNKWKSVLEITKMYYFQIIKLLNKKLIKLQYIPMLFSDLVKPCSFYQILDWQR